jgi:hypothetical protein
MIIYGVVGFVVLAWLLVFIGFIVSWLGIGGSPAPTPGS